MVLRRRCLYLALVEFRRQMLQHGEARLEAVRQAPGMLARPRIMNSPLSAPCAATPSACERGCSSAGFAGRLPPPDVDMRTSSGGGAPGDRSPARPSASFQSADTRFRYSHLPVEACVCWKLIRFQLGSKKGVIRRPQLLTARQRAASLQSMAGSDGRVF